jgi:hypothetical protein
MIVISFFLPKQLKKIDLVKIPCTLPLTWYFYQQQPHVLKLVIIPSGCLPEVREGYAVLLTPHQALRQYDRQVNKRAALLVGSGLTAAAKVKCPTVGKVLKQDKGWRSQSPCIERLAGQSGSIKQFCEGSLGMAEPRSPTAVRDQREVKDVRS